MRNAEFGHTPSAATIVTVVLRSVFVESRIEEGFETGIRRTREGEKRKRERERERERKRKREREREREREMEKTQLSRGKYHDRTLKVR